MSPLSPHNLRSRGSPLSACRYVRPLYKALGKVDYELAKKTFLASSGFLHPIARNMVAKDLKLENVE